MSLATVLWLSLVCINFSVCWYERREMDLTEVLSCPYVWSLVSSRPFCQGWGNAMPSGTGSSRLGGRVAWRCAPLGLLCQGALQEWRQVLITGDPAAVLLSKCLSETALPFQRIITPFPLLLTSTLHFSTRHTTAFLPTCTLARSPRWCLWFTKPRAENLSNIRFTFAHPT